MEISIEGFDYGNCVATYVKHKGIEGVVYIPRELHGTKIEQKLINKVKLIVENGENTRINLYFGDAGLTQNEIHKWLKIME